MTSNLRNRFLIGFVAAMTLLGFAVPASAAVVRNSAGTLASGYTQSHEQGQIEPGWWFIWTQVTENATGQIVCVDHHVWVSYCSGWVSGYTVTGNGYEVTKP